MNKLTPTGATPSRHTKKVWLRVIQPLALASLAARGANVQAECLAYGCAKHSACPHPKMTERKNQNRRARRQTLSPSRKCNRNPKRSKTSRNCRAPRLTLGLAKSKPKIAPVHQKLTQPIKNCEEILKSLLLKILKRKMTR